MNCCRKAKAIALDCLSNNSFVHKFLEEGLHRESYYDWIVIDSCFKDE